MKLKAKATNKQTGVEAIIESYEFTSIYAFAKELRSKGYQVSNHYVKPAEVFDRIVEETPGTPTDWRKHNSLDDFDSNEEEADLEKLLKRPPLDHSDESLYDMVMKINDKYKITKYPISKEQVRWNPRTFRVSGSVRYTRLPRELIRLEISRKYFTAFPGQIESTIIHELIHIYQRFDRGSNESSHGPIFEEKQQEINKHEGVNVTTYAKSWY